MNAGCLETFDPIAPIRSLLHSRPAALRPIESVQVNYRVLMIEGCRSQDALLAEAVRAEIPDAEITRAAGALGAIALIELYHFNLLLVDGTFPPEVEEEILREFEKRNPEAEMIISTALPTPSSRAKCHTMQAPVNPLELIETIRGCRDRSHVTVTEVNPDDEGYFVVVLTRHSPMEVVQLKCLAGATTALDFIRREGPGGRVWFARGEIIHAETGSLRGDDALIEMMNWPGGSIVEVSVPPPMEITINEPWTHLLMRAAHAADERKALAAQAIAS